MTNFLTNKHILLGVTGSVAAYKSADLVRRLREAGAVVRVVMSENAKRFITPLTLQAVSGLPVHDDLFDLQAEAAMGHIELARWADVILVAPATAGFMARLSAGFADDLLTTLCLASKAPIMLAPAMNQGMLQHEITQENMNFLRQKKMHILATDTGSQACGDLGPGRMLEPLEIKDKLCSLFAAHGCLAGRSVMVTAGPTQEAIDPIRFITNGSSGKMGYALACAAREHGANVTLVSGPVNLAKPSGMEVIAVISAQEMYEAVMQKITECDIFIAVAAVGDYRSRTIANQKIHKTEDTLSLTLERNQDIVASVAKLAKKPFVVGFAAETERLIEQATEKRRRKKMDMIIANQVGHNMGMGSDDNTVTVIGEKDPVTLPSMLKHQLADQLIKMIADEFRRKTCQK